MDSQGKDPTQTPRKAGSKIKEVRIDQENIGSLVGGGQSNLLAHNSSTVSRTSISSFKRSAEPTNIQEEVVDVNQTTDLDTLILKAQQNYALSKQVIDKITNCNENITGQATFANLMEVKSTLTARVSDDQYDLTQRNHLKSQGQGFNEHPNNLKDLSDNDTNETNGRLPGEEYYALKPQAQLSSLEIQSSTQQPQPAVRPASSAQNSPSAIDRVNQTNNVQVRRDRLAADHSQASLASNLYVHTEAPVSDRQPPDVLREHLIQKLGFKPEPLPSIHSQREQLQEYNEQMEQLKKLQEKFSSEQFLKINQTSGSIVEDDGVARSAHNESELTLQTQEGDEIHTFNRKLLLKEQGLDPEAEFRDKCSPSPVQPENSRVDTGHFNSRAGITNEMNIINSLNIDASQASPSAPGSPDVPKAHEPNYKVRGSKHDAYSSLARKEYSQGLDTSLRYMAHLSPELSSREPELAESCAENTNTEPAQQHLYQKDEASQDHGRSIPSSIHSRSPSESAAQPTVFSLQLQKLYDNISVICPKFGLETGESSSNRIEVSPDLQHHSSVLAIQLYNQVCYLYQQVKELKLASLKKMDNSREELQLSNQTQIENNMLKMQVDNFQKETDFYKGQIDMLQEQLRLSAYRDRDSQTSYEQRIETLLQNISELEARNSELEGYVKELEDHNKLLDDRNQQLISQQNKLAEQKDDRKVPPKEYMDFLNKKNENSEKLSQLQLENRELRQKLKMQEEIVGFEKDLNMTMKKQLENIQETKRKEIDLCKKDISRLQDTILQKNETIKVVTQQIDDFASLVSIEFPLFGQVTQQKDQYEINLANHNKSPKFISMRKDTSNEVVMGLLNQFDSAIGHSSFTDHVSSFDNEDANVSKPRKQNSNLPFRGKINAAANKKNKRKRDSSQTQAYGNYEKLFNLPQMVEQQIATTIFSDHILKDHKVSLQNKNKRINEQFEYVKELEEQMILFKKQKDDFSKNQKQLTKDNEELKVKFSQLLDQFQEYVNESEKKTEEEQTQQKAIQDKLLNDLNSTIRELEEMSQNLQRDGEEKDQIISSLQKERDIVQKDMTFLKERFKQTEEHKEQLQNVKIQSLNEEINYLKKHYMVELDVLKQENKNLRMKMRTQSENRNDFNDSNALHPQFQQQSLLNCKDRQNSFERQISYQNDQSHSQFTAGYNVCEQSAHDNTAFMNKNMIEPGEQSRFTGLQYQRNSSCNPDNSRAEFEVQDNLGVSGISRRGRERGGYVDSEDRIYPNHSGSAQPSYHNLRSKSHDRTLGASNSQLLEDKLEHSISNGAIEQQNQGFYPKSHYDQKYDRPEDIAAMSYSASKINNESMFRNNNVNNAREFADQDRSYPMNRPRVGNPAPRSQHSMESRERAQIVGEDQILRNNERLLLSAKKESQLVTSLKKELDEKQQLVEFQNQEIVQLRFEFEELKAKSNQTDITNVSQMQRSRLLMDIDGVIETLKSELERVKVNLWNEQQSHSDQQILSNISNNVVKEIDEEIHAVKSEDRLMTILSERVKKMNRLLSLSSEILLLSTKQKYMPQQNRYNNSTGSYQQTKEQSPILIQNQNLGGQDLSNGSRNQVVYNQENGAITSKSTFKQTHIDDEALIDENNSLKRTIYKYENTLAQLDSIFRRDNDKEECIYELKKLTENQLHQILRLQKEVDAQERRMKQQAPSFTNLEQENDVLKQEIAMLRERLAHFDQNREQVQTQFSTDKIQLSQQINVLEQQLQEKQKMLNDSQAAAKDREAQLDEIRSRITVVAELFEKKPIKQRYSFEVLCDFIHDKAKRLFTKYENALKEKKHSNDEKLGYYQRRVNALEMENEKSKDSANLIRVHVIPKLASMLNKNLQSHNNDVERAGAPLVRELMDELAFQHNKLATTNARLTAQSLQTADKMKHLQAMLDHQQSNPDVIKMGATDIADTNTALNTFGNQSVETVAQSLQNQKYTLIKERSVSPNASVAHSEEQKVELDRMRKEKHEMNQKLEEFAQIMRDFQANQQMQAEENGQLKMKIDQLEHAKRSLQMPPDDYDNM